MDKRPLTQRLRSGFGGIVPPICDEAANRIDNLEVAIQVALQRLGADRPFEAMDILAAVPIGFPASGGAEHG
jgi:hypothetical protein